MAIKRKIKKSETEEDLRPKWRKITNGTHYHSDKQVVKKGDILYANEWELSDIIKIGFECLDELPDADLGKILSVRSRGGGWFDVVNSRTLQKLNSKPLRREVAESFLHEGQEIEEEEV